MNLYEAQGRDKIKGVVWPRCLAILCYVGGDVGHVVYMCEGGGGSVSLGEESDGIDRELNVFSSSFRDSSHLLLYSHHTCVLGPWCYLSHILLIIVSCHRHLK